MRIFINALSARLGGGQTYLLNLLEHVPSQDGLLVFVLVQPSFPLQKFPYNVIRIEQSSVENPLLRAIWEETRLVILLKQLKIDLFFSPGGLLPRYLPCNILTAVTFQNMMPFDHEQRKKYPFGYRVFRDWLLERFLSFSMRRANLVIFISEFAREFVKQEVGLLQGENIVVPHGIHPSFKANSNAPLLRPSWLPMENYFLYVSFVDHYKAHLEVVRGFNLYRKNGGKGTLVFVGPEYKPYGDLVRKEIDDLALSNCVLMVGKIPHSELPAAYQHARINLFASLTENCPNILLEMMASGRPALVSNRPPMPEFGEDAVAYFNPDNVDEFAHSLAKLESDEILQNKLSCAATEKARKYTWESTASLTWSAN
jgi:glycosyltransferase involved in cell wall biosynthesis